ncbi:Putative Arf GTPase activating protein [Colletotrichum destructivum]|uniref:Arf GTPase activating protein n=1 Tax=Colletotrichum destructivum TaxID=34406 RepID=A0AAX4IZG6_9PEZI|nr:Putative Arf GTPase activating protein [Colletotrichum destructivum]
MAGVLSKRQQARNEKVLHDLVQSVPGNNFCADCQARNPAWASWSLGVFLCMRCAAIHRKLGTHISKVKSLSMDSWSNEQVENMKKVGNVRSNQIYNQDNKKPPVPVDADEADSAMERFIRTKYVNNKPVPVRKQHSSLSDEGIPPPLPPKSGGKFGFRSASSIFPLSSRLKKDSSLRSTMSSPRDMPRSPSPTDLPNKPSKVFGASVSYEQEDTERKLVSLRDMGFSDGQRNAMVLKGVSGNLERAIETLVRLGESDRRSPSLTGPRESSLRGSRSHANLSTSSGLSAPQPTFSDHTQSPSTASSNNPFDMLPPQPQSSQSTGTLQNKNPYANNPFGAPTQQQQDVNQAFGNLSLAPAQPLFPHHTGGLPASQPFAQPQQMYHQSMTPPVPQQQQSYNPMSFNNNNMTYPQPIQPQATGYNPFFTNQMQPQLQQNLGVNTAPTSSPFANNPFTRSPTRIQSPSLGQIPEQSQTSFYTDSPQTASPQTSNPFFAQRGSQLPQAQQQMPQAPPQQSYQQQFQQEQNPFQQQGQQHFQPQGQQQFQQGQPLFQQQETGQHQYQAPASQPAYQQPQRPDKASILALYNYPQLAPQTFAAHVQPQEAAQTETAAPRQPDHDTNGPMQTAGNKNPFLANGTTSPAVAPVQGIGTEVGPRKPGVSRESMAFTDMQWTNGRHSPDAFASLSARHM